MRIRRLALEAGDAPRHATRARHSPDVLRVSEGDLRCANGGRSQHARAAGLRVRSAITELKNAECDRESDGWKNRSAAKELPPREKMSHELSSERASKVCV